MGIHCFYSLGARADAGLTLRQEETSLFVMLKCVYQEEGNASR